MVLTDSCLAVSMNEQVLTTITSASSAWGVICAPPVCNSPIITSLSTRFLGHPKLTKPTFRGAFLSADFSCGVAGVGVSRGMQSLYFSIGNGNRLDSWVVLCTDWPRLCSHRNGHRGRVGVDRATPIDVRRGNKVAHPAGGCAKQS